MTTWMTVEQYAAHLQISKVQVERMTLHKELPVCRIKSSVRIDADEADSYIKKHMRSEAVFDKVAAGAVGADGNVLLPAGQK